MASNLRVDTILPSTGTNVAIGTASGSVTFLGDTDITTSGSVSIGGTLTYEDVTNVDSVGVITARSGINVTSGDVSIADKIIHTGDTNTAIRFPAADTITAETNSSERLRITSGGLVGIGSVTPANQLDVQGGSHTKIHVGTTGTGHATGIQINHAKGAAALQEWQLQTDATSTANLIIRNATSGNTIQTFNTTGAVTKPLQPSFGAYGNASWTTINSGNGSVPVLPNVSHNVGSSYNTGNGTFTCPVAGLYQVMFHTLVSTDDDSQNDNTRSFDVFFQIGGSNFARHHVKRGYQNDGDVQVTMDMTCTEIFTINTTVSLYFYANAGNQRWYGAHTYFGVTLLS